MFCKNCGSNVNDGEMFCPACGAKQDVVETPAAPQQPVYNEAPAYEQAPAESAPAAKKGFNAEALKGLTQHKLFKPLAAIIAVLLVICIVVVPVVNTLGSAKKADFYLYMTEKGELFIKYSKDKEGKEISDDISDDEIYYVADKKTLFFKENDDSTLYYVNISKKEIKPEKIDNDVSYFEVSEDGKIVWFMSDGDLYVSDLKESNKIESDVSDFYLNKKGDKCVFFVRDDKAEDSLEAYDVFSTDKKGKIKTVAEEVSYALGSSREDGLVFWQDREVVYSYSVGASKAKEAVTVENWSEDSDLEITGIVSEKEFYYTIEETLDAMDFISDSHDAEADKDADYDTEGYYRDYIREVYAEETISSTDLHYVKGGKDKGAIATGLTGYPSFYSDLEYLRFSAQAVNKEAKINIEDLADAYQNYDYSSDDENQKSYYDVFNEAVYGEYSYNLVIDGNVNVIASAEDYDDIEVSNIAIDEKGKTLYYINGYDEEDHSGKLYKASISGKKLNAAKELYSDVCEYGITEKGKIITLRDYDDGSATLYVDKKEIEDDVSDWSVAQDGTIFYKTNSKAGSYTLNQLNGNKGVKIADDVYSFAALGKDDIMFLDEDAELFQYAKKGSKSIEDDVYRIMVLPSYYII